MAEIRVQDEQGTVHVFPDGSTPDMIAQAMNVKPPSASGSLPPDAQIQRNGQWIPVRLSDLSPQERSQAYEYHAPDPNFAQHTYEGVKAGLMAATAPLALGASLPKLAGGVVGGMAGQVAGQKLAQATGKGPMTQEVTGDIGSLVGGGLGSESADWVGSKALGLYKALPEVVQKELLGMLSPRALHAVKFAQGLTPETPTTATAAPTAPSEQFSFTHAPQGQTPLPAGPIRTNTAIPPGTAAPPVSAADIKTSPGFQMPERKMPANIPPLKASDFAQPIKDIVDQAVPPENKGMNAVTQSKVEFALKRGDVAQAEAAIDSAAKQVKSNWPPESPVFRGGVNDIREATKFKTPEDLIDDRGIQQEMARDLEVHGLKAESEARREFIARNSTGITKGELTGTLPTAEGAQIRAANQAAANASTSSPGASAGTAGQVPKAFLKKAKWLEDRLNQQK